MTPLHRSGSQHRTGWAVLYTYSNHVGMARCSYMAYTGIYIHCLVYTLKLHVYTCIFHVQAVHIHFQAFLLHAMIQTCIYMAYTFTVLYIYCNSGSKYIHVYIMYILFIYIFKHSCHMLGDRNLPICTYWAQAKSLGCSGVCQFVYTGHRQQSSLLIQCIYNYHIL